MPSINIYIKPDGERYVIAKVPTDKNSFVEFFDGIVPGSGRDNERLVWTRDRTHARYFRSKDDAESQAVHLAAKYPGACLGVLTVAPLDPPVPNGELEFVARNSSASGDLISFNGEVISGDCIGIQLAVTVKTDNFEALKSLYAIIGRELSEGWNSFMTESLEKIPFTVVVQRSEGGAPQYSGFRKSDRRWTEPNHGFSF